MATSKTHYEDSDVLVVGGGMAGTGAAFEATYWGKDNVRCNSLAPGGVYENTQDEKFVKKISSLIPMGRMASKDDIIGALCFLLSDSSSYVNGQVLLVDGGRTIW